MRTIGSAVEPPAVRAGPGRSFSSHQFKAKCAGEPAGDLALKSEQIASVAVEPLRPEMRVGRGIDQLGADADLATGPPDAAFEHKNVRLARDRSAWCR